MADAAAGRDRARQIEAATRTIGAMTTEQQAALSLRLHRRAVARLGPTAVCRMLLAGLDDDDLRRLGEA